MLLRASLVLWLIVEHLALTITHTQTHTSILGFKGQLLYREDYKRPHHQSHPACLLRKTTNRIQKSQETGLGVGTHTHTPTHKHTHHRPCRNLCRGSAGNTIQDSQTEPFQSIMLSALMTDRTVQSNTVFLFSCI